MDYYTLKEQNKQENSLLSFVIGQAVILKQRQFK